MQAGTFFPVMRSHNNVEVRPHFPWLFGPQAEAAIRKALELRYRLVPLLYSLGHQAFATGEPLMRPLVMQYPADPKVADLSSEWLLGHDLLAAPVVQAGGFRTVYLPDDIWYDFATGDRVAGGRSTDLTVPFDAVPVYVPRRGHPAPRPGGAAHPRPAGWAARATGLPRPRRPVCPGRGRRQHDRLRHRQRPADNVRLGRRSPARCRGPVPARTTAPIASGRSASPSIAGGHSRRRSSRCP